MAGKKRTGLRILIAVAAVVLLVFLSGRIVRLPLVFKSTDHKVHLALGFHGNLYHSYRIDTNDEHSVFLSYDTSNLVNIIFEDPKEIRVFYIYTRGIRIDILPKSIHIHLTCFLVIGYFPNVHPYTDGIILQN